MCGHMMVAMLEVKSHGDFREVINPFDFHLLMRIILERPVSAIHSIVGDLEREIKSHYTVVSYYLCSYKVAYI